MPTLDRRTCMELVTSARVGRLATVTPRGVPHAVPVCFALTGDRIVSAVDAKPKSTRALRRVANVAANPVAALLVDHYDDDWSELWWVRVDASVAVAATDTDAARALAEKYAQYAHLPPEGPFLVLTPTAWTGWSYERSE